MSRINIVRTHNQSHEEILETAQSLANDIGERFGIRHHWEGDRIVFDRPGVSGHIDVLESEIKIAAKLGMMLLAMKGPIEHEVNKQLDKLL